MMVVVIIIGVLAAVAVLSVRGESYGDTVQGFGREIVAEIDVARTRAVASGKQQQLEFEESFVTHWEATKPGMGYPTEYDYEVVRRIQAPRNVLVSAFATNTYIAPNNAGVSAGDNMSPLPNVQFFPDGSSQSATIFLTNAADDDRRRVAIFRATGTAYVFNGW